MRLCLRTVLAIPAVFAFSSAAENHSMPPNPAKIGEALVRRGVVPQNASGEERQRAANAYVQRKLAGEPGGNYSRERKNLDATEAALGSASLNGRKLGQSNSIAPSTPAFRPLQQQGKLVRILVEFSNTPYTWTPA